MESHAVNGYDWGVLFIFELQTAQLYPIELIMVYLSELPARDAVADLDWYERRLAPKQVDLVVY